ncbi:MAG: glycosyltransferase [Oscillospiraceae bacterium]|nr:glycosyltransferase [Oscillospiraceae bacterium]
MKKVLMITTVHPWNDGRIFEKEAKSFVKAGWRTSVLAPGAVGEKDGVFLRPLRRHPNRAARMLLGPAEALIRALLSDGAVCHLHDPELLGVGLMLKAAGRTVVWDAHEDLPLQMRDKQWIPHPLRRTAARWAAGAEEWIAPRLDLCVCATSGIARRLRASGARTVVVRNLPRPEQFLPTGGGPERKGLVYVGGISLRRGAAVMAKAAALCGAPLQLAGRIEAGEEPILRAMPAWGQARYHGVVDQKTIARILEGSCAGLAVLQPTPAYREALPVKALEYMAAGIPAVISDFPQWRRIFGGAGCMLFADPENPREVAEKAGWLLDHPEQARRMGEQGRTAVLRRLNWQREEQKLLQAYETLNGAQKRKEEKDEPAADRPLCRK